MRCTSAISGAELGSASWSRTRKHEIIAPVDRSFAARSAESPFLSRRYPAPPVSICGVPTVLPWRAPRWYEVAMVTQQSILRLVAFLGLAAVGCGGDAVLETGRYELAVGDVATDCPPLETSMAEHGLLLDVAIVEGEYWGADELVYGARLEGGFDGGGAWGQGDTIIMLTPDASLPVAADAQWSIALYPEDGRQISGTAAIDLNARDVTSWQRCAIHIAFSGARL